MVGTDLIRAIVGRVVGDRLSLERLTGIDLDALDESLTHIGEWFEDLYPKDDE